jgi:Fes/CIP4, and EFC/F-BAR homology domain
MSFASDLWDQSGNIANHLDSEIERMQSLAEFFKQISQAEEIYSSALQKITKQDRLLQPGSGNSVYVQTLANLVKGVHKVSDSHQKLASMLEKMSGTITSNWNLQKYKMKRILIRLLDQPNWW